MTTPKPMIPVALLVVLALAYFVWSCVPRDETILSSQKDGHTLNLIDQKSMRSIGDLNHVAILEFDGKVIASQTTEFPVLPERYPQFKTWIIHEYGPDLANPDSLPWTVYVDPQTMNRAKFDQLVACFEARRTGFDTAMDNFARPGYINKGRVARIIYGKEPETLLFKPAKGRYLPVYPNDIRVAEKLTIRPNGQWAFTLWSEDGRGGSLGGDVLTDTLVVENGQLTMTNRFVVNDPMFKPKPDMVNLSDDDYLRSFADSTGRPLLQVIRYPF